MHLWCVANDFTDPNLVLDQNHFVAQVNTLYTNTIVTKANQLWIHGFANASSRLLFSRIICSWMCENSLSPENREGRHRMRWSFRVMRQCCSLPSYMVSHSGEILSQPELVGRSKIAVLLRVNIISAA